MIQFENVTLKLKDALVLRDISMEIQDGEFAYLVGNSGSGKSSIHQLIYGNFLSYEGTVIINGQDIQVLDFDSLQQMRQKIGIIFQDYKLIADKTVFENISIYGGDERTPVQLNGFTWIGATHGTPCGVTVTSANHGVTYSSIGNVYKDPANIEWVLLRVAN